MFKIKKCQICKKYTLKSSHCNKKTKQVGYKFIKTFKNIKNKNPL